MEPVNRNIDVMPGFGEIIQAENIPLQELPEHYTALANKAKDIYNLYALAFQDFAVVEKALEDNAEGEVDFTETADDALKIAAREIEFLNREITHLKNQKIEITKAAEEKDKSAQGLIKELKQEITLRGEENDSLNKKQRIIDAYFEEFEKSSRSRIEAWESRRGECSPYTFNSYTKIDRDNLIHLLEIEAKLQAQQL